MEKHAVILIVLLSLGGMNPAISQSYQVSGNIASFSTNLPVENAEITLSDPVTDEVYISGIFTDAQGDFEAIISIGATAIPQDPAPAQRDYKVTRTFPNPVRSNTDLTVYYNSPDPGMPDPVVELYDSKGTLMEVPYKLAPDVYYFRLRFPDGRKTGSQKLVVLEGSRLEWILIRNNGLREVAKTKSTLTLLDVKLTVEKPGYVTFEEERSLSSESDNRFELTLTGFESVLTPAMRIEILDSIESKLNQLEGTDLETRGRMVLEYLNGISEIQDVEMDEYGSVWASFIDGKLIYIASSLYPLLGDTLSKSAVTSLKEASASGSANESPSSRPNNVKVAGSGMLPSSKSFRLINGVSSYYESTNPLPKIRAILLSKGYTDAGGEATLESLRNVKGDGIFYFRSHGDVSPLEGNRDIYALWTQSEVGETAEIEDTALISDLAENRVVYMLFKDSGLASVTKKWYNKHYGITHLFVDHYMTFAPNGLVYIDACNSSVRASFRNAFKGPSLFIGWDNFARYDKILSTSQYMFDRLLGANKFDIPVPPQRPFEYTALPSDPDFGPGQKYGFSQNPRTVANLGFFHLRDDFAMLAPSIRNLEIDEANETMEIHGKFGPDPGDGNRTILIGERSVDPQPWTDNKISVDLKPEDQGEVVIKINGIESNKVPLTSWRGVFAYTYQSFNPTLTENVTCSFHFRADVHPYRDLPGNPVQYVNTDIITARDSKGNWKYSGREDGGDGCTFTEISGEGNVDWVEPGNEAEWHGGDCEKSAQFVFRGTIDPKLEKLECNLVFWVCGDFTFAYKNAATQSCVIQTADDPLFIHDEYLLAPLKLDFDGQFHIPDGNRGEINDDFNVQLVWRDFVTTAPPTEQTPSK